jgi:hypothetical protein
VGRVQKDTAGELFKGIKLHKNIDYQVNIDINRFNYTPESQKTGS